ncbi:hypothetical protein [Geminicoccus flavidas]|uniref:hypothetical protein n=1 Tax=Geminicoccus flavidas TaxID=2506407 RepID=UPI00135A1DC3|nr:hypothetical protein [Geminicoccus flavidas]
MRNANLHTPLPKHGQVQVRPMLAAACAELGVNLTRLAAGRHRFACRNCQRLHRNAAMLVVVAERSTTWSCEGCGTYRSFTSVPRHHAQQVAP